jgi:hypothetical protein
MGLKSLVFWLLLASFCFGQTKAVIEGPESALPGELVVLNSNNSIGDSHRWIVPDGLSTAQAGCDSIKSQVFFATPREGSYKFILIVSDKEANIEFDTLVVEIRSEQKPPPVENPPPVKPDPKPPGTFQQLTQISRDNSLRLNDPTTRKMLADSLQIVVNDIKAKCSLRQCPTLEFAQRQVQSAIESTLLQRKGNSRDALWLSGWRVPNNTLMQDLKIESSTQYAEAIQAIVDGLK